MRYRNIPEPYKSSDSLMKMEMVSMILFQTVMVMVFLMAGCVMGLVQEMALKGGVCIGVELAQLSLMMEQMRAVDFDIKVVRNKRDS